MRAVVSGLSLVFVGGIGLFGLFLLFNTFPAPPMKLVAKLPALSQWFLNPSTDDIRVLNAILSSYLKTRYYSVLALFCGCYVFLQTMAIPGAVLLSALAGALYGPYKGLVLVTICSVFGSLSCRQLYLWVGAPLVQGRFAMRKLQEQVEAQRAEGNLLWFFLFLRVTPILPNWLLNVFSGHVGIPVWIFTLGTAIGLLPNNILMVTLGAGVSSGLSGSLSEHTGPYRLVLMFGLGIVALLPIWIKRMVKSRIRVD